MNYFDRFSKVYCLNLPERIDRWDICERNFKEYNLNNVSRFEGFVINKPYLSSKGNGQLGCMMSFKAIFEEALLNGYESILILEDDFQFTFPPEEMSEKLKSCLNELPDDWDMFYLGANIVDEFYQQPIEKYSDNLYRLISGFALHSVAISNIALRKIVKEFKIDDWVAVDIFFAQQFQAFNKCFISKEILSLQRPDFSSIEGTFFDYNQLMIDRFNLFSSRLK